MRKAWLYIFSFACLLLYALSLNRPFMEWWADYRTYTLHAAHAKARYGDLYSNCFLPGYLDTAYIPLKENKEGGNTDLYILHDSYLEGKITKENFRGINKLVMADYRGADVEVRPDKTKRNILVIECSERTAEWRFTDTLNAFSKFNMTGKLQHATDKDNGEPLLNYFFNPNINQNLEFMVYDYEYFIPLKNAKAWLNYRLFKRLPKDVSISTDEKYLLLSETVDPRSGSSSFAPLNYPYLDHVTRCVNRVGQYYKSRGFDEVYFSVIPNPVSIVDEYRGSYNHKIEWLEKNTLLQSKYLSICPVFQDARTRIYRTDDTHWNGNGLQLWVDEVNKIIQP